MYGDHESVLQNIAYVSNFRKTAAFRICPKQFRKGQTQFQTVLGKDLPSDQVLKIDYENDKLVCLNSEQTKKPEPPNFWFHKKIKCMDYKLRHQCQCLFGCLHQNETHTRQKHVKIALPKVKTLFDECEWKTFVDTSTPSNDTWDAEVRGKIAYN